MASSRSSLAQLAISLVLLSIAQQLLVYADYDLQVAVYSYSNPSHRHALGGCCDNIIVCFNPCDNYFLFCLRALEDTQGCPLGEYHSGEVGGDSLAFRPGGGRRFGRLSNPLHFRNIGNWTGFFQLLIEVNDDDDFFPATLNGDEFVDLFAIARDLAVSNSFTRQAAYVGKYRRGTIVLSFRVVCLEDYYGADCGTLCVPLDSSEGHYTCDNRGNRVCLAGYQSPASNCTQCLPAEGCSTEGGYCTEPYECLCHSGFTGELCESAIDVCSQTNPCLNGGSCETGAMGNPSCSCALGFMGPMCEDRDDETTPTSETTPTDDETTPSDGETTPTSQTTPTDATATETTPSDAETTPSDAETTPTDAPTTETTPTDAPTTETTPSDAETTPTDAPATETTPTDAPTTETTPSDAETTPTDAPATETTPTDAPATETTPTDATATETTPTDAPATETTPTDVPATETTPTDDETTPTDVTATETTPTDVTATETTPSDAETTPTDAPTTETTPTDAPATETTPSDAETTPTDAPATETTPTDDETTPTDVTATETTPTDVTATETTLTDASGDGDETMPTTSGDEAPPTIVQPAIPLAESPGLQDPTPFLGGSSGSNRQQSSGGPGAGVLAAAVAMPLLVVLLSVVAMVTLVLLCRRQRRKWSPSREITASLLAADDNLPFPPNGPRENPTYIPSTVGVVNTDSTATSVDHEFDNPLYSESMTPPSTSCTHDYQPTASERSSSMTSEDHQFHNPLYSEYNSPPPSATYASVRGSQPATSEGPYMYSTISPRVARGVQNGNYASVQQRPIVEQYTSSEVLMPVEES